MWGPFMSQNERQKQGSDFVLMITTILVPLQRWNFKTFMLAELELG
jgi:hypothetical protein